MPNSTPLVATVCPKPQEPSMTVAVSVSRTTTGSASGTILPSSIKRR